MLYYLGSRIWISFKYNVSDKFSELKSHDALKKHGLQALATIKLYLSICLCSIKHLKLGCSFMVKTFSFTNVSLFSD